jgi:uncharacterized protein (DUF302 family)
MNDYALSKPLSLKFDEAVAKLPEALATEGFGVLTQIDVQNVFAQKLQAPFRRYRIFGACNPSLAHRALNSTLYAGVMIPCNVILWEEDNGTTTVAAVNPVQAPAAQAEPAIAELARDVVARLERVFTKLG